MLRCRPRALSTLRTPAGVLTLRVSELRCRLLGGRAQLRWSRSRDVVVRGEDGGEVVVEVGDRTRRWQVAIWLAAVLVALGARWRLHDRKRETLER